MSVYKEPVRGLDSVYRLKKVLKEENGEWFVCKDADGTKLGGPYTKEEAERVLQNDGEDLDFSTEMEVKKFREDQQLVFGWASIALDAKGIPPFDWQDDLIAPDLLEKAAYDFVLKYRATGENHEGGIKGSLVESVVFTKEKMAAMGIPEGTVPEGWWVGFHIPTSDVFGKIKDGTYKMFSIQGKIKRLKV